MKYWVKILSTQNRILKNLFEGMYTCLSTSYNSWVSKNMLSSLGFNNFWYLQSVNNPQKLFAIWKKQRLTDIFIQERNSFYIVSYMLED